MKKKKRIQCHKAFKRIFRTLYNCPNSVMCNRCKFEKSYLLLESMYLNILCVKIQFKINNLLKIFI